MKNWLKSRTFRVHWEMKNFDSRIRECVRFGIYGTAGVLLFSEVGRNKICECWYAEVLLAVWFNMLLYLVLFRSATEIKFYRVHCHLHSRPQLIKKCGCSRLELLEPQEWAVEFLSSLNGSLTVSECLRMVTFCEQRSEVGRFSGFMQLQLFSPARLFPGCSLSYKIIMNKWT